MPADDGRRDLVPDCESQDSRVPRHRSHALSGPPDDGLGHLVGLKEGNVFLPGDIDADP